LQTLSRWFSEFWQQLSSALEDLGDWVIYVFDPNSGPWPKAVAGGIFFLIVMFIVTRASKAK
jgi:hypothetical protein